MLSLGFELLNFLNKHFFNNKKSFMFFAYYLLTAPYSIYEERSILTRKSNVLLDSRNRNPSANMRQ